MNFFSISICFYYPQCQLGANTLNQFQKFENLQSYSQRYLEKMEILRISTIQPKSSKSSQNQQKLIQTPQNWKIDSLEQINHQNIKLDPVFIVPAKSKLIRKQQQRLILFIFSLIIENPFLNLDWGFFKRSLSQENIKKITLKQIQSVEQKINQLESVWIESSFEQTISEFLVGYWKKQGFRCKKGTDCVKKIEKKNRGIKMHMEMGQIMLQRSLQRQNQFQSLYRSIMRK